MKNNVIRLYDVKPEMALEHLKRSTGLDFKGMPQNLVGSSKIEEEFEFDFESVPVLTDVVS